MEKLRPAAEPSSRAARLVTTLVGIAFAVALVPHAFAAPAPDDDALRAADEAYARGDLAAAGSACADALKAAPADYEALWRSARAESELGEDASGDARRALIAKAVEHARSAVRVAPDSALGHVWLSVSLGRQALKEGPKAKLALAREIKSEVDRALAIDPNIGRAYHVRAIWNREIASLNWMERTAANTVLGGVPRGASMENAVRDLQKSIELEPRYVNHHLELGRTYLAMHRSADARSELEKAVTLPPTSNPRDPRYQTEARALLAKLPAR